jgi:hypothetical protein
MRFVHSYTVLRDVLIEWTIERKEAEATFGTRFGVWVELLTIPLDQQVLVGLHV